MSNSAGQNGDTSEREMPEFSEDENLTFFFNIEQIYSEIPGIVQNYATFSQSLQIGKQLVQYIIKNSLKQAEEQFIERNVPLSTISEIQQMCNHLIALPLNDGGTELASCLVEEDLEPQLHDQDRWRRNRVYINQKNETEDFNEQLDNVPTLAGGGSSPTLSPSHHNRTRHSISQDRKIVPGRVSNHNVNYDPKMVPLPQDYEEDEFEDKLRTAKLYEIKKKNEIEQRKKEDLIQSQIEKKEGAQQKYTFDYDGKIIPAKPIKMEKLQPTNQKVKIDFKDVPKTTAGETKLPKTKEGMKESLKPQPGNLQEVPNKAIQERKDPMKEVLGDKAIKPDKTSQFPYETFLMNNGVKLMFEHKIKEGQRHQVSDSAEQLQYRLSGANFLSNEDAQQQIQQIRLTRTEYKLLTDSGSMLLNQTKQQFMPNEQQAQSIETQKLTESQVTNLLNKKKLATTTGANEKAVHFETPAAAVKEKLPPPPPSEKIQLKNAKMVENLIVPSAKPDTPIQGAKPEKPPQEEPKNPVDQFNQQLLQSKDWGKQGGASKTAFFPPIKQGKLTKETKQYRGSLEQLYKLPRDRLVAQNLRTASDFFRETKNSKVSKSHPEGFFQTFYTTHSKFDEKLRQS